MTSEYTAITRTKEHCKYASQTFGGAFVETAGTATMLKSPADNWGLLDQLVFISSSYCILIMRLIHHKPALAHRDRTTISLL